METTIRIEKKGVAVGTVGWLVENLKGVRIGVTKHGDRAAWAQIGDTSVCLVVHDAYGLATRSPEFDRLDIVERYDNGVTGIALPWCVTDACWESLRRLAEQIKGLMEADTEAEERVSFSLTKIA